MLIISIIWALSSYGTPKRMERVEHRYEQLKSQPATNRYELDKQLHAARLETSYAGILGESIEPAIIPLGYDWKIGIALISSFAAREGCVGNISTVYRAGYDDETYLNITYNA